MIYVVLIVLAVTLISAVVSPIAGITFFKVWGLTWIAVAALVLIDAIVATTARLLPAAFADHEKKIFTVSAKEKKFYEKIKIRKWKDKVPEIGHFTGFRKNKLEDPQSVAYVDRFLLESCYGEIGHFFSCIFGFFILLLFPISKIWLAVAIPAANVNVFLNVPSLFILRYNSYKLKVLRKANLKKQRSVAQN
jgi:glycosyl-4,4'-diaponeurosporenoate acyltransferase